MKNILLPYLIAIAFINLTTAQKKISELDSITFLQLEKINQSKDYKNVVIVKNYQTSKGEWLSIGDTLIIGKPSNANNLEKNTYVDGSTNTHSHIMLGTTGAALMGTIMMANENMAGDKAVIINLKMGRISKRQPFDVVADLNKANGVRFLGSKKMARAYIEKGLNSKELINPNAAMTREEAISKLKEAKELLDLEMMTQDEYDKLKVELSPIIKAGN